MVGWDCFGAPIFWPLFSDRLAACRMSAVNAGQGQQAGPGFSIIQLLGAAATDKTRQDRTPFAVRARCKRYCTRRQGRGAERRGVWKGVVGQDEVW